MTTVSTDPIVNLSGLYIEPLLTGDRENCRKLIDAALAGGLSAHTLLTKLVWPTMELLQSLYREDRISISSLNMATRLNRTLTDQLCSRLERQSPNGKKVLIFCGNDEPEELGGQICADLFEADGYNVRCAGGGVPEDEVRKLIGYLREVNSCPEMQIMCCGGIYKRAEGLSEEIGADLYAPDAADAVQVANEHPNRKATVDQQTVGRTRRIRKAEARKQQISRDSEVAIAQAG